MLALRLTAPKRGSCGLPTPNFLVFMAASSGIWVAPPRRRRHADKMREIWSARCDLSHISPDRGQSTLRHRNQDISNQTGRNRRNRYNLSDRFNPETKDF
jgi:hypothetical protein